MKVGAWDLKMCGPLGYYALAEPRRLSGVTHGFSTRLGGLSPQPFDSLNLGTATGDLPLHVSRNRQLFLSCFEASPDRLKTLKQVHSTRIATIRTQADLAAGNQEGDALVTGLPGLFLGVLTADCYPILLADTVRRVIAAVHAGWRGTAAGIAAQTVKVMSREWGSEARDVQGMIGPGIASCCYEVGEDVRSAFLDTEYGNTSYFQPSAGDNSDRQRRWMLDMVAANRDQLLASGIKTKHLFILGKCTACDAEQFFSYRRDGVATGRMLSIIGLTND